MLTAQERLAQVELDLDNARAVQRALVPKSRSMANLEVGVHCTPADSIGGDICDVFEADGGRTAVVIGDVSGKGVAAGLLTGVIYGAVHSSPWTESSFHHEDATERLNDFLRRKTSADRFVSLFWGYFELETSTFRYINAGHLPMLLIRRTNDGDIQIDRLEKGGPVLGIVEWGNYQQGHVHIEEGDLLVMFSDGIVEAMDGTHDQFGEQRLLDVVRELADAPPEDLQNAILNTVRTHMGKDYPEFDDQTLLIARFHNVFTRTVTPELHKLSV